MDGDAEAGSGFSNIAPNASALPYVVRYTPFQLGWRLLLYGALVLLFLSIGAADVLGPAAGHGSLLTALFSLVTLIFCLSRLWALRMPRATFHADRVEAPGLFGTTVLHRQNVKGVGKTVRSRNGSYFDIVSSSPDEAGVRLDGALRTDPIVADWLRGATDPAAEALKAGRAAILADPRYGASEAERAKRLDLTKQVMLGFNLACLALAGWLFFLGDIEALSALLAFGPLLVAAAVVSTSGGLVGWYGLGKAHPSVVGAFAPPMALAARAGFSAHLIGQDPLIWLAVAVGIAATTAVYVRQATAPARVQNSLSLGAGVGLVAYGLTVALNVCLDTSPPRTFVALVTDQRVSHRRSTSYYLSLGPWSDRPPSQVSVSSALYDRAPVGSRVCIRRRSGALGVGWFDLAPCLARAVTASEDVDSQASPLATAPAWLRLPDGGEMARYYPERAQRLHRSGRATIKCAVDVDGGLNGCRVLQESPAGFGFGDAAVALAPKFRMHPATTNGRPIGGASVVIPVRWSLN